VINRWTRCTNLGLFLILIFIICALTGCSSDRTWAVSGTVTVGGQPIQGVTMTLRGGSSTLTTTTNANGYYHFDAEAANYTLTPSMSGFVFSPFYRNVYLDGTDANNFDFVGSSLVFVKSNTHTLHLKADGHVWAWGDNGSGQLGDGTNTPRNQPVAVKNISNVRYISAGNKFSVALLNDGTVWAWGDNTYGQLGNGTTGAINNSNVPVPANITGVVFVAAGGDFVIALRSDGNVWAWGNNSSGQLGNGTTDNNADPAQISWSQTATAVAAGYDHALAISSYRDVWAWGSNSDGQIGADVDAGQVSYFDRPFPVGNGNVTAISAGNKFSFAVDGSNVWSWGRNLNGQLGQGNTSQYNKPVTISNFSNVALVSAGDDHALAVKTDGSVWSWGNNDSGQLGNGAIDAGRTSPAQVNGISSIMTVSAGVKDSFAMRLNNTVWGWGYNAFGQIGDGTNTDVLAPKLIPIP